MNDILFAGKHFLTYNVHRHKHATWELVYCTGASGRFVFDDMELPYQEGDVVVIPPDVPHENLSESGFTNIHLNIGDATLTFTAPTVIRDDVNHSILHLFSDVYYLFCGDPERNTALLPAYGTLIVRHMTLSRTSGKRNRISEEIEKCIVQNYANADFALDEVLHSQPYCYDYLCKLFRKEVGTTPHKYLINIRLQAAANMLCSLHNSAGIAEVAQLCGFRNPLYFSRLFKNRYGVSPKEYHRHTMEDTLLRSQDSDSQKILLNDEDA